MERQRPTGRKRRRRRMTGAPAPVFSGPQGRPLLSAPEAGRISPARLPAGITSEWWSVVIQVRNERTLYVFPDHFAIFTKQLNDNLSRQEPGTNHRRRDLRATQ